MNEKEKDVLCRLIRDHEDMIGSSRTSMLALQAFATSIENLKCAPGRIREEYFDLAEAIKTTRPKIIPLIHLIEEFEIEMEDHFDGELAAVRARAVDILRQKEAKLKAKIDQIIQHGLTCIDNGDVIVMHTVSGDVLNMIAMAKAVKQKNLKVIVLKQDFMKTKKLINSLQQSGIETEVVPEFSLSHYIGEANKMFTGALSITHDLKAVSAVGIASIASMCHFHKIPVYLFANTLKFSHGASEDQRIHEKKMAQVEGACNYVLTTFSHDKVDLEMVDYLVTEEGIIPRKDIRPYVAEIQARDPRKGSPR